MPRSAATALMAMGLLLSLLCEPSVSTANAVSATIAEPLLSELSKTLLMEKSQTFPRNNDCSTNLVPLAEWASAMFLPPEGLRARCNDTVAECADTYCHCVGATYDANTSSGIACDTAPLNLTLEEYVLCGQGWTECMMSSAKGHSTSDVIGCAQWGVSLAMMNGTMESIMTEINASAMLASDPAMFYDAMAMSIDEWNATFAGLVDSMLAELNGTIADNITSTASSFASELRDKVTTYAAILLHPGLTASTAAMFVADVNASLVNVTNTCLELFLDEISTAFNQSVNQLRQDLPSAMNTIVLSLRQNVSAAVALAPTGIRDFVSMYVDSFITMMESKAQDTVVSDTWTQFLSGNLEESLLNDFNAARQHVEDTLLLALAVSLNDTSNESLVTAVTSAVTAASWLLEDRLSITATEYLELAFLNRSVSRNETLDATADALNAMMEQVNLTEWVDAVATYSTNMSDALHSMIDAVANNNAAGWLERLRNSSDNPIAILICAETMCSSFLRAENSTFDTLLEMCGAPPPPPPPVDVCTTIGSSFTALELLPVAQLPFQCVAANDCVATYCACVFGVMDPINGTCGSYELTDISIVMECAKERVQCGTSAAQNESTSDVIGCAQWGVSLAMMNGTMESIMTEINASTMLASDPAMFYDAMAMSIDEWNATFAGLVESVLAQLNVTIADNITSTASSFASELRDKVIKKASSALGLSRRAAPESFLDNAILSRLRSFVSEVNVSLSDVTTSLLEQLHSEVANVSASSLTNLTADVTNRLQPVIADLRQNVSAAVALAPAGIRDFVSMYVDSFITMMESKAQDTVVSDTWTQFLSGNLEESLLNDFNAARQHVEDTLRSKLSAGLGAVNGNLVSDVSGSVTAAAGHLHDALNSTVADYVVNMRNATTQRLDEMIANITSELQSMMDQTNLTAWVGAVALFASNMTGSIEEMMMTVMNNNGTDWLGLFTDIVNALQVDTCVMSVCRLVAGETNGITTFEDMLMACSNSSNGTMNSGSGSGSNSSSDSGSNNNGDHCAFLGVPMSITTLVTDQFPLECSAPRMCQEAYCSCVDGNWSMDRNSCDGHGALGATPGVILGCAQERMSCVFQAADSYLATYDAVCTEWAYYSLANTTVPETSATNITINDNNTHTGSNNETMSNVTTSSGEYRFALCVQSLCLELASRNGTVLEGVTIAELFDMCFTFQGYGNESNVTVAPNTTTTTTLPPTTVVPATTTSTPSPQTPIPSTPNPSTSAPATLPPATTRVPTTTPAPSSAAPTQIIPTLPTMTVVPSSAPTTAAPTLAPGTIEVVVQVVQLRITGNQWASLLQSNYAAVESQAKNMLASTLGFDAAMIIIYGMRNGSLIIDFGLAGGSTAVDMVAVSSKASQANLASMQSFYQQATGSTEQLTATATVTSITTTITATTAAPSAQALQQSCSAVCVGLAVMGAVLGCTIIVVVTVTIIKRRAAQQRHKTSPGTHSIVPPTANVYEEPRPSRYSPSNQPDVASIPNYGTTVQIPEALSPRQAEGPIEVVLENPVRQWN